MASRTAMMERLAEAERAQKRFAFAQEADADHRHHSMVMRKTMEHHGPLLSVECWAYFIAAKRKCQQGDTGQNG